MRVVIVYSGGLDSYTLLHKAIKDGLQPVAITAVYGQKHQKEAEIAKSVCDSLGVEHILADITSAAQTVMVAKQGSAHKTSSLLANETDTSTFGNPLPLGHYSDASMALTVVPNRNMLLLSLAISLAVARKIPAVWYGAHGGDSHVYADCRPAFVHAMQEVAKLCDDDPIELSAPWLRMSKTEIISAGLAMGVDYSQSWTCYAGRELSCGKCGACVARMEAFDELKLTDPLPYETN